MDEEEKELQLEGIVHARRYVPGERGKPFLGATIESSDGMEWVIDYDEQSPFHAFAARRVVACGEPYKPEGQFIGGKKIAGHFRVSTLRLVEMTDDAPLVEVGTARQLTGRFERGTSDIGESTLSFVTQEGVVFAVANDPAGVTVGLSIDVWAYPVRPSPSIPGPSERSLWIICPCSAADLWEWRGRRR